MAKRRQQPIKRCLLIIGSALIVLAAQISSDLNSPALFLFKALIQPISAAMLMACLIIYGLSRSRLILIATLFAFLVTIPFLLPKLDNGGIGITQGYTTATTENTANGPPASPLITATFSTLTRTQNVEDIVAFAESEQPNLLCLQEVSKPHRKRLAATLKQQYPYQLESENNQFTLSTHPLTLINENGQIQNSVLGHPKWGDLTVINAHMSRPYRSNGVDKAWDSLFTLLDSQTKVIVCGDLNITPNNTLYDLLLQRYALSDAHSSGYGFTFPNSERKLATLGPFIRIDYVFTQGFTATHTRTINASNKSDHKAVLTHLRLETP